MYQEMRESTMAIQVPAILQRKLKKDWPEADEARQKHGLYISGNTKGRELTDCHSKSDGNESPNQPMLSKEPLRGFQKCEDANSQRGTRNSKPEHGGIRAENTRNLPQHIAGTLPRRRRGQVLQVPLRGEAGTKAVDGIRALVYGFFRPLG